MNVPQSEITVNIEEKSQVERCLKVEIPRDVFDKCYNAMLTKATSQAHMKGFRPGRAPRALITKLHGQELQNEALYELLSPVLTNAIKENQWNAIGTPSVDTWSIKDGMPVEITASVYLFPDPKIEKWEGIETEVEIEEFHPDQIEHHLMHIRENFGSLVDVTDRQQVCENDYAVVKFTMSLDGEVKQETGDEPWMIHVSKPSEEPKDISAHALNRTIGERFTFNQKFPSDYSDIPDLADREGTYDMEIVGIKVKQPHELNDDFLKKLGFNGTIDELKENMSKHEQERISEETAKAREEATFAKLVELNPVEIPKPMVDFQYERILEEIGANKKDTPITEDKLKEFIPYIRMSAVFRASRGVILQKIVDMNEWKLSEEEFQTWIEDKASKANVTKDEFCTIMDSRMADGSLMSAALSEYAIKRIIDATIFNEKIRPKVDCCSH